jgi:ketosteroid isomerase-like protein
VTGHTAGGELDFDALRRAMEQGDVNAMLSFYAETAVLHIENEEASPHRSFQLCGRPEIAKHLRAVFNDNGSHRIEHRSSDQEFLTYREICQYPDGSRLAVETTLTVIDGTIAHQTDRVGPLRRAATGLVPPPSIDNPESWGPSTVPVPTRPPRPSQHPTQ